MTTQKKVAASVAISDEVAAIGKVLNLDEKLTELVQLGQTEADDNDNAVMSRNALVSALIEAGFTYANTVAYTDKALKDGTISNEVKVRRDQLMLISLASISTMIRGYKVRLSPENLARAMDDTVAGKAMLDGMPKGTINGETTWRGNASSHLNRLRKAIQDAEGGATKGTDKVVKTLKDKGIESLVKSINYWETDVEKQDGSVAPDVAKKFAAYLRDGAAQFGLKLPAQKAK